MASTSASEMGRPRSRYSITASTHDSSRGGPVSRGIAPSCFLPHTPGVGSRGSSEDGVSFELEEETVEKGKTNHEVSPQTPNDDVSPHDVSPHALDFTVPCTFPPPQTGLKVHGTLSGRWKLSSSKVQLTCMWRGGPSASALHSTSSPSLR